MNGSQSPFELFHSDSHHTAMTKPESCLEPTRSEVEPSSSVLSIISSHHCPTELPSSPTYIYSQGVVRGGEMNEE